MLVASSAMATKYVAAFMRDDVTEMRKWTTCADDSPMLTEKYRVIRMPGESADRVLVIMEITEAEYNAGWAAFPQARKDVGIVAFKNAVVQNMKRDPVIGGILQGLITIGQTKWANGQTATNQEIKDAVKAEL